VTAKNLVLLATAELFGNRDGQAEVFPVSIWHDRRASGQYGRQAQRIGE
jgi:hypothetical protein